MYYNLILESDVTQNDTFSKLSYNAYKKNCGATPKQKSENAKKLIKDLKVNDKNIFDVLAKQISSIPSNMVKALLTILNKVKNIIGSIFRWMALKTFEAFLWLVSILFLFYFKISMKFSKKSTLNESENFPNIIVTEKDVEAAWSDVIKRYKSVLHLDLSYMSWNFSEAPRGKDGSLLDLPSSSSAGSWTPKHIIFLNPKMIEAFNTYKPGSVKTKRKLLTLLRYVIARELAYEIWSKRRSEYYGNYVASMLKAAGTQFSTDNITSKHIRGKAGVFAAYIASLLVPKCIVEGVNVQEALFNSEYARQFISYAYDTSLEFIDSAFDTLEEKYQIPRKAVGVFCFLSCVAGLFVWNAKVH